MVDSNSKFQMDGVVYEHADRRPDFTGQMGTVRRFTNGEEPEVMAQVPLARGARSKSMGVSGNSKLTGDGKTD